MPASLAQTKKNQKVQIVAAKKNLVFPDVSYENVVDLQIGLLDNLAKGVSPEEVAEQAYALVKRYDSHAPGIGKISIIPTDRCNLRCRHCYISPDFKNVQGEEISNEILFEHLKEKADEGARNFCLPAVEPFCAPEKTQEILEYLDNLREDYSGIVTGIITNGTLITKNPWIADVNLSSLNISCDGKERDHDSIRGKGNYKRMKDGLKWAIEKGIDATVLTSITPTNVHGLEEMISDLSKTGLKDIELGLCFPTKYNDNSLEAGKKEFYLAIKKLPEMAEKYDLNLAVTLASEENSKVIASLHKDGFFHKNREGMIKNLEEVGYPLLYLSAPLDEKGKADVNALFISPNFSSGTGNYRILPDGSIIDICVDMTDKEFYGNPIGHITDSKEDLEEKFEEVGKSYRETMFRRLSNAFTGKTIFQNQRNYKV